MTELGDYVFFFQSMTTWKPDHLQQSATILKMVCHMWTVREGLHPEDWLHKPRANPRTVTSSELTLSACGRNWLGAYSSFISLQHAIMAHCWPKAFPSDFQLGCFGGGARTLFVCVDMEDRQSGGPTDPILYYSMPNFHIYTWQIHS